MSTDYRIVFTITRREDGDDDFTEIGFGSSGAWASVREAAHDAQSILDNNGWETSGDMPDPATIDRSDL